MAKKEIVLDIPKKVKLLGINFSPRRDGITAAMMKQALEWAETMGYAETELVHAADYTFYPCKGSACQKCFGYKAPADATQPQCYEHPDDGVNVLMPKTLEADGILYGFPIHAAGIPSTMRIFQEKDHQISTPLAFTRWAGARRYKAVAVISQGSGVYTGQMMTTDFVTRIPDTLIAGPRATPDAPAPMHGSGYTTVDGLPVYGKDSYKKEASVTVPPVVGSRNERALKNVARFLAMAAMFMKVSRLAFEQAGFEAPEIVPFTEYYMRPEPGSYVDKLMKEGKVKYVSPEELRARVEATASSDS
ncbi:MAG: flavodoxin family protein [Chloroflexi bacterium]|nr:flavodoxin family protein [Chloroflexota bacterium]